MSFVCEKDTQHSCVAMRGHSSLRKTPDRMKIHGEMQVRSQNTAASRPISVANLNIDSTVDAGREGG